MSKLTKFSLLTVGLVFALVSFALAQETNEGEIDVSPGETIETIVALDEDVTASDLEVSEPTLLPDSPFYFLKNWQRGVRSFFTFGAVNKAKLRLKFASEKLIEVRKLAEKAKAPEIIKKAAENYQKEVNKIKIVAEKIKEKATENLKVGEFLDKFIKHQILHQKVLEKLETQVPEQAFEKIKEVRERHLERFGEVMQKLEETTELGQRLEKNLQELKGSEFKNFKNLQILKNLEEKVPEEVKEAIINAKENTLEKMKEKLEKMSSETQEKFENYIEKIQGVTENKIEILEDIGSKLIEKPEIRERLRRVKEKILFKIPPSEPVEPEKEEIEEGREECIKEGTETGLGLLEAKKIALASECGQKGVLKERAVCNKDTGTWWIDLDVYDEVWEELDVSKEMCNPACVVNVITKEAKINWRCMGLLPQE